LTRAPRTPDKPRSRTTRWGVSLGALLAATALASPAAALEPWSDADPPAPPERFELGHFGFRGAAEYRAEAIYVNPIALSSETGRRLSLVQQRLRLDGGVDYEDKVRLVTSLDLLDGLLWGDNGTFGGSPSSNAGTNVGVKSPNFAKACIGYRGGDPLQPEAYGYTLCDAAPVTVRKLYADAVLPFGLLRVGRQPANMGTGVQSADGDGRPNRFGVSGRGNLVDRVLFATKPLEAFKPAAERDRSEDRGFFLGVSYDRLVGDDPHLFADDVHQVAVGLRFLQPKWAAGRDLWLSGYYVHRWDGQFGSKINSLGARGYSSFGPKGRLKLGFDVAANLGSTREISEAYKVVSNDPAVDQAIRQIGGRGVARFDTKYLTPYLEVDYASGNSDPQARAPLTQFVFAEDTNVGLLLFKHVLAFQTARSSAAALETLRRLGAPSYPAEAVATRGAFTNAFALFPQLDFKPHKTVLVRGGVMFAWAPAPVNDPVASLKRRDSANISDDLVNFNGGKPGRYYGTELDGRIQYRFLEHFLFDLEGAILFPGDALRDADGNAVRSVLVQGRTTFFF
jgi:hypothetical protein